MSGEEKKEVDVQTVAKQLGDELKRVIQNAQNPDQLAMATQPFKQAQVEAEKCGSLISRPKDKVSAKKELIGLKTWTFLDNLYLDENEQPLGGIPMVCQLGIVGNPEVGKSILAQEIALRCASDGRKVIFITSEDAWEVPSPRNDLQSRMKRKTNIMDLDWDTIRNNLFVLDTISHSELRNWTTLVETYRYLVEILKGIDLLIVDSLTLLESYRGALKWRVMELSRYNQVHGITAIYVSQRGSEEAVDKLGYAGGVGIGHNLDGTICIDFKKASGMLKSDLNRSRPKDQQLKQWDLVHFVRNLGCRLCAIDRKYHEIIISSDGLLDLRTF